MDSATRKTWDNSKHVPAKRSDVLNPIRALIAGDLKIPDNLPRPLVNLGLGEPSKANGFPLP